MTIKPGIVETSDWEITVHGWHPENNRFYESIFSLGNEHFGLRGFFEEKYTGDTLKGTYTAGIYYPDKTRVGWWKNGYPEFFAKVLNNTNWAGVGIELNGVELDLNDGEYVIEDFVRTLDMKRAVYTRTFTATDKTGRKTRFEFLRFLSMEDKTIACISIKASPLNYSGEIILKPYLDGNIRNEDANYDEIFWDRVSECSEPYPAVTMETKKTLFRQTCSMACTCLRNGEEVPARAARASEKYAEQEFAGQIGIGDVLKLDKIICLSTSRSIPKEKLEATCLAKLGQLAGLGVETLLKKHESVMRELWDSYDVRIQGDPASQQGIRYNILQLLMTYSGSDAGLNIGPKGFTGEKYGGMTYWDTEAFCFPFYLYQDASVARNLLLYRFRQLDQAKVNAQKLGLEGALYPMATMDGLECHNEWEITFEEIHRNGAIAYAIYHYTEYTGDTEYIKDYGLKVLVELSRFWASRVTYNAKKDCYMILGVTGPNEYENNVNNNFYTNTVAAWTLEYTLKWLDKAKPACAADTREQDKWRGIASKMYFPYVEELGIFEQNDLFMDKDIKPVSAIPASERPINQHWSWDRILRSCYIKQADVLQSMYFFPRKYSLEEQRRNFEFYEPITVHESSLSPSIHAIVAARIGFTWKAYELYLRTSRLDLENVNNDTSDGLHITSMGATWAAVIQGFAGVSAEEGCLNINPNLPDQWDKLEFTIHFRGAAAAISIRKNAMQVLVHGNGLRALIRGCRYDIKPGIPLNINL